MKYRTGNPVGTDGSTDPRDMYDNAGNLDKFLTSEQPTFPDRLNKTRPTLKGFEIEHQSALDAIIMVSAGDFFTGTVVTARNQTVLWSTANGGNGHEYRWAGALNKIVPANSTPLTTGGIYPDGQWIDVGVTQLRRDLAPVAGIKFLRKVRNLIQFAEGYVSGQKWGGGFLVWLPNEPHENHNGIDKFADEAVDSWPDTIATINELKAWSGTGFGCWVRVNYDVITPEMGGIFIESSLLSASQIPVRPQLPKSAVSRIIVEDYPTNRPVKIGEIVTGHVTQRAFVSVNALEFLELSQVFDSRDFFEFDSIKQTYIELAAAYSGYLKLRVYPYRNGSQGLPDGAPILDNHAWSEFTIPVSSLNLIGKNGSQYFSGIIDYIELVDLPKYDLLSSESSYLNGIGGKIVGPNNWLRFYMLQDNSWISENIRPKTPFSMSEKWSQQSNYEYSVVNASLDTDALELFPSLYSNSRKLKVVARAKNLINGIKVTPDNVDGERIYRNGLFVFSLDRKTLKISRMNASEPVSGTIEIQSVCIKLEAI